MVERHDKIWGYEEWIVNNELYCGKILHINHGYMLSLHYHKLKDETFYVLEGKMGVCRGGDCFTRSEGGTLHIPVGRIHTVGAISDVKLIEFSTQHFDSDSHRLFPSGYKFGYTFEDFCKAVHENWRDKE